jgi:hypothetical protein
LSILGNRKTFSTSVTFEAPEQAPTPCCTYNINNSNTRKHQLAENNLEGKAKDNLTPLVNPAVTVSQQQFHH